MKAIIQLLVITTGLLIFAGCNEDEGPTNTVYLDEPSPSFTFTGNNEPAPVDIQFYNHSENANSYFWQFGDGSNSNEFEPMHRYYNSSDDPVTYNVVLAATDTVTDRTFSTNKSITILPAN